jgi:hypothetical protein
LTARSISRWLSGLWRSTGHRARAGDAPLIAVGGVLSVGVVFMARPALSERDLARLRAHCRAMPLRRRAEVPGGMIARLVRIQEHRQRGDVLRIVALIAFIIF